MVGREKGFPKWVAMRLPKRIAPWTFIRLYAKDGRRRLRQQKTVMTQRSSAVHTMTERRRAQIDVFADARNRTGTNIPPTTIAASQTRIPRR